MAKGNKPKQVTSFVNPQSGNGIAVNRSIEMQPNGTSLVAISLDFTTAPVPERKYLADIATVVRTEGSLKLLFAQKKISGDLRSLLIVDLSPVAVRNLLKSTDEMKNPSYEDVVKISKVQLQELTAIKEEPDQTVAFKANLTASCASGHDSCMDFYYISPFSVLKLNTSDKVEVDPVVRVDMPTGLLMSILYGLKKEIEKFPVFEGSVL